MVLYGTTELTERAQARQLLAAAAQESWGLSPLPALERQELGKPFFPDFPQRQFNLSHSEPFALCALDDQPVGVDIQVVKSCRRGLPERVCSLLELEWLSRQPEPNSSFFLLWSLKEARVKQSGLGLRTPIREINVPLPERWEHPILSDGLWFWTYGGTNWTAAVCGLTPPPSQIQWRPLCEKGTLQPR